MTSRQYTELREEDENQVLHTAPQTTEPTNLIR